MNDSHYYLGLDIGNDSSAIAFYNAAAGEPELIDISGGYGRPTSPTAMQYIPETREWVYGEYAILNAGHGPVIKNLVAQLANHSAKPQHIEVDGRPMPVTTLLGLYIKELLSNVWNINPKAEIAGIVAVIPAHFSKYSKNAFRTAFKRAGYEKELLTLATSGECIFNYHYREGYAQEQSLIIDYGADSVRGGIYLSGGDFTVKNIYSYFDEALGTAVITAKTTEFFRDIYIAKLAGEPQPDQMEAFVYQHKDLLFQKAIRERAAKLYFNFAYPPFVHTVTAKDVEALTAEFKAAFNVFLRQVLENPPGRGKHDEKPRHITERITAIDSCLCTGGGFEMLWARESLASLFPHRKLHFYKNSKSPAALGAAILAARLLGADLPPIKIEDTHRLTADIGIAMGKELAPLAEIDSFWWQKHTPKTFIINQATTPEEPIPLEFIARAEDGTITPLATIELDGLPVRPKGTTKLSVNLRFESETGAVATIRDCGFGEMFPAVDYVRECGVVVK